MAQRQWKLSLDWSVACALSSISASSLQSLCRLCRVGSSNAFSKGKGFLMTKPISTSITLDAGDGHLSRTIMLRVGDTLNVEAKAPGLARVDYNAANFLSVLRQIGPTQQ